MFFCNWIVEDLNDVEDNDGAADNQWLSNFKSIDTGEDVDCVCAEDRKHAHVDVIQQADVDWCSH